MNIVQTDGLAAARPVADRDRHGNHAALSPDLLQHAHRPVQPAAGGDGRDELDRALWLPFGLRDGGGGGKHKDDSRKHSRKNPHNTQDKHHGVCFHIG